MAFQDNQCGQFGPSEQILAESAALIHWLFQKAIAECQYFIFSHFFKYIWIDQISKNYKPLLQEPSEIDTIQCE